MHEFVLLTDYKDEQREISLFKDDIIEVLDISKSNKWLVRTKYANLVQVKLILVITLNTYLNKLIIFLRYVIYHQIY
jgi:hypothetical protein